MANPIPIVSDVPRDNPGLGFPEYAEALADTIRGGNPPQFTIGIYGQWGSGKSSLLNAIAKNLSRTSDVVPVLFDAWRYERSGHIVVPLLHRIYKTTVQLDDKRVSDYLKRALISVIYSLKFNLGIIQLDTQKLQQADDDPHLVPLDDAFDRPFAEMSSLAGALKDIRIAVLIDDLDRCSPENVVAVLESINLIMDIPGIVFVLALDYDMLIKAVSEKYPHASGHVFIEKMVQVPFRVPRLRIERETFLDQLVPEWSKHAYGFPGDFLEYSYYIAVEALEANPRQVKRLINSFLVLRRIVDTRSLEIDNALLAALIGLQLRWPQQYHDFADAVYAGDQKPYEPLLKDEDFSLRQYAEVFFAKIPSTEMLRDVLQLAQAVAPQPYDDESGPPGRMSEVREIHRERFIDALQEHGFLRSPRSERLYYNGQLPNSRFVMGKHYVRLEYRQPGRKWELHSSFLLTQEIGRLVKLPEDLVYGRPIQGLLDSLRTGSS